jgi:hypothetical protein
MARLPQRGIALLAGMVLTSVLAGCSLAGLGVSAQIITLPSVLVSNSLFWVGDRCRADENYKRQHDCPPGYTIDLYLHGRQLHHYTLLQIPSLR